MSNEIEQRQFVEAEGCVHLVSPTLGGEFTLCGDAFDLGSDIEGYAWQATRKRTVTCKHCARIVSACRGVRIRALIAKSLPSQTDNQGQQNDG